MSWWNPFRVDVKQQKIEIKVDAKAVLDKIKSELKEPQYPSEWAFTKNLADAVRVQRELKYLDKSLQSKMTKLINLLDRGKEYSRANVPINEWGYVLEQIFHGIDNLQEEIAKY